MSRGTVLMLTVAVICLALLVVRGGVTTALGALCGTAISIGVIAIAHRLDGRR